MFRLALQLGYKYHSVRGLLNLVCTKWSIFLNTRHLTKVTVKITSNDNVSVKYKAIF